MTKAKRTISTEDYLERIHELTLEKGYARAVDLAEALGIRPPSVTLMVQRLAAAGYLNYARYRGMTLTPKGTAVAETIQRRHAALTRLLDLLGIPAETRDRDIEGIEHHISEETLAALTGVADLLERDPSVMAAYRSGRRGAAGRKSRRTASCAGPSLKY